MDLLVLVPLIYFTTDRSKAEVLVLFVLHKAGLVATRCGAVFVGSPVRCIIAVFSVSYLTWLSHCWERRSALFCFFFFSFFFFFFWFLGCVLFVLVSSRKHTYKILTILNPTFI